MAPTYTQGFVLDNSDFAQICSGCVFICYASIINDGSDQGFVEREKYFLACTALQSGYASHDVQVRGDSVYLQCPQEFAAKYDA